MTKNSIWLCLEVYCNVYSPPLKTIFQHKVLQDSNIFDSMPMISLALTLYSRPLKTIFQHKVCTDKLYADSFYKAQKSSHSSFEVICCRS